MTIIKNALIHDAVNKKPYRADIAFSNGKITAIGKDIKAKKSDEVIDATGLSVYPGFVEAHCHTGMNITGAGPEGSDINERTDTITPHIRAIDALNPTDETIVTARNAGVTTICTGPGSANVVGGTFAVIKTYGNRIDDMCIIKEAAMKCAFGQNPKGVYKDKSVGTRMMNAARLRELLFKAKEYDRKVKAAGDDPSKLPSFDMKLNAMLPVVRGEMPLKAHAHQANDIFTAIRIAREFGVKLTLEHVTEGHLIADALAAEGYPVVVGPSLGNPTKLETRYKSWKTPGILQRAGCTVSITTDAGVTPQDFLPILAGLAVKAGMDPFEALKAITINAAKHIGADKRVGSLEKGKDADIVVTDGSPFEISTKVKRVFIDGKEVFKAE